MNTLASKLIQYAQDNGQHNGISEQYAWCLLPCAEGDTLLTSMGLTHENVGYNDFMLYLDHVEVGQGHLYEVEPGEETAEYLLSIRL